MTIQELYNELQRFDAQDEILIDLGRLGKYPIDPTLTYSKGKVMLRPKS